ncbi:MAG TPA: TonB C-terminal domain-containing protein [Casimicrobiaceae bacterium]|nr:TonB C-terminal domain-containing protein [Casimicrobiaceae bacterium]
MQKSERPRKPRKVTGKWLALALALLVQAAFVAVLVFSVHWQNRKPEPMTAELYAPPSKAPASETAVPPASPPPPQPAPRPVPQPPQQPPPATPPKPAAVPPPEPKVARPDTRAADVALRARQEEERKKAAETARKDEEKKARAQKEADERKALEERKKQEEKQAEARARQQRETEALRAQAEREGESRAKADRDAQAKAQLAAQRGKAEADWIRSIQAKVRGNVIVPPEIAGNPEAIFEVVQLPTGEIIDVQLRKSSGVRAYDDAVQRAILKSSPLPRAGSPDLFQRSLTLKFRPLPE